MLEQVKPIINVVLLKKAQNELRRLQDSINPVDELLYPNNYEYCVKQASKLEILIKQIEAGAL